MKSNMGAIDRTIRILVALFIAVLYFTGVLEGMLVVILGIIAAAFVLTGFVGYCPLYLPLKVSTKKKVKTF